VPLDFNDLDALRSYVDGHLYTGTTQALRHTGDPHTILQAPPRPQLCCLGSSSMAIVGASAIASLSPSDENAYLADIRACEIKLPTI
jgi:hypothetical protein